MTQFPIVAPTGSCLGLSIEGFALSEDTKFQITIDCLSLRCKVNGEKKVCIWPKKIEQVGSKCHPGILSVSFYFVFSQRSDPKICTTLDYKNALENV